MSQHTATPWKVVSSGPWALSIISVRTREVVCSADVAVTVPPERRTDKNIAEARRQSRAAFDLLKADYNHIVKAANRK